MAEHYTKNTLEITAWCPQCSRDTQHRVDGGRKGPCIDPAHPTRELTKDQQRRREQQDKERREPKLFP